MVVGMPSSVWAADVAATKENVAEEAKWLIDVAVSLMRLSTRKWRGPFPRIGDVEAHPIYPTASSRSHVTLEDGTAHTGGGHAPGWYDISPEVAAAPNEPEAQKRAVLLFDSSEKPLAQRVAQGLGWMTRGPPSLRPRRATALVLYCVRSAVHFQ